MCRCQCVFKRLGILPLLCEYIFHLMNFIMNKEGHFKINSLIHSLNTKNKSNFHRPIVDQACFQKCEFYADINISNKLTCSITNIMKEKEQFKCILKFHLSTHAFYSIGDYLILENNL